MSGSRKARRPPPTRAEEARRMGITLVIPTKEAKMEFPKMAPTLQTPVSIPKAVALDKKDRKIIERFQNAKARDPRLNSFNI